MILLEVLLPKDPDLFVFLWIRVRMAKKFILGVYLKGMHILD